LVQPPKNYFYATALLLTIFREQQKLSGRIAGFKWSKWQKLLDAALYQMVVKGIL